MIRQIIHIDEDRCSGCGICANACHEGAIDIVAGKARLVRENFCDGFGDCLPGCPMGAITFEKREAPEYDESAVKAAKESAEKTTAESAENKKSAVQSGLSGETNHVSKLANWPVQIRLAPLKASYFDGAGLLIAADCTAYAYAAFHEDFIKDNVTLIGCPKLDAVDYSEKLTAIIANNDIRSVLIVRMEVPCCGGLESAVRKAVSSGRKDIPCSVVTVGINGKTVVSV